MELGDGDVCEVLRGGFCKLLEGKEEGTFSDIKKN